MIKRHTPEAGKIKVTIDSTWMNYIYPSEITKRKMR